MARNSRKPKKKAEKGVKSLAVTKIEIRMRDMGDHKRAALYLHVGKRRFTLEYELDAGMPAGYFPLVISEVSAEEKI